MSEAQYDITDVPLEQLMNATKKLLVAYRELKATGVQNTLLTPPSMGTSKGLAPGDIDELVSEIDACIALVHSS